MEYLKKEGGREWKEVRSFNRPFSLGHTISTKIACRYK